MSQEVYEKWGFGMAPPKQHTQQTRVRAATYVLNLIEGSNVPDAHADGLDFLSTVKGLFSRVAKQDQWDWFTVSAQLGYPSYKTSKAIANEIAELRSAMRNGDEKGCVTARTNLRRLPARRCLGVFLDKFQIVAEPDAGWIYILSTREIRELLKIGMTRRTVEERVREINAATGVAIPFGVRCCWRVSDPSAAERLIHGVLADYRVRLDREFFRINFYEAKKKIQSALQASDLEIRTLDALGTSA